MTRPTTRKVWVTPAGPVVEVPVRGRRLLGRLAAAIALRISGWVDGWDTKDQS